MAKVYYPAWPTKRLVKDVIAEAAANGKSLMADGVVWFINRKAANQEFGKVA